MSIKKIKEIKEFFHLLFDNFLNNTADKNTQKRNVKKITGEKHGVYFQWSIICFHNNCYFYFLVRSRYFDKRFLVLFEKDLNILN